MRRAPDETLLEYQSIYGEKEGKSVYLITNATSQLFREWRVFLYFFAGNKERVDALNASSGSSTRIIQKALWDSAILKIRRLTDPAKQKSNNNLSLEQLVRIADRACDIDLTQLHDAIDDKVSSCNKHADKYLAHSDLPHAHGTKVAPVTRQETTEAVVAIGDFVRLFHQKTRQVDYALMPIGGSNDEKQFLMHLFLGHQKDTANRKERLEKAKSGAPFEGTDHDWPEWIFNKSTNDLFKPFET
ncbi:hypothetical protein [Yoonia sp. I 8.24]|uniref:AbiU2 domain-containing protein n=1 Tax=Yoonia sp. I 8.24 TaxID=1537229 RepID=UPI001EDDBA13|nr:hypothetical protein [Yoonia sp. I 8.24]MCG3267793.1 hypothetical protein [Yoonia sp. I 8.24]